MCSTFSNGCLVHDICGRIQPKSMIGKPLECLQVELDLKTRDGDVFIVTFPKTGTTLIQFICHLLRTGADERGTSFEDIHQVSPHMSSAWYINQDLNAEQPAFPRLFKSHRMLQQVTPFNTSKVKFIATIREPFATLVSCYEHRKQQGRLSMTDGRPSTLLEFAQSSTWLENFHDGSIQTLWDHLLTFWNCREASNFLLLPFEDLVTDRERWIPIIADFMEVPYTPQIIKQVADMTSVDSMLNLVSKFDESWIIQKSNELGHSHPTIKNNAAKVTNGHKQAKEPIDSNLMELHQRMWTEKIEAHSGLRNYSEMRKLLRDRYFKNTLDVA